MPQMTRETKVGLLIGTLILLLVGIVVSDHLAVKQEQDRLSSDQHNGIHPQSVPRDTNDLTGTTLLGSGSNTASDGGPRRVIPTIDELGIDRNLESIPGINQRINSNTGGNATTDNNGSGVRGDGSLANNANARNAEVERLNNLRELLRINNLVDDGNRVDNGGAPGGPRIDSGTNPGNTNASNIRPVIHYVKSGETLWAIADQYYGDGNKWTIIKNHNKDKVPTDNQVREGVRLEIPKRAVEGGVANNGNGTHGGNAATTGNRTTAGRTVTVQSGDNLTRIAQVHLGSARHVNLILKANQDKIRNADQIRVGMVLQMPAAPGQPAAGNNDASNRTDSGNATRSPSNGNAGPTHAAPVNETTTAALPRKYVVQEGDTLSAVAAETLGNRNRWKEIWTLNKNRIPNPNVLSEGLALTLPARER